MYFLKKAEPYIDTVQISSGIDKIFEANVHCITTNLEEEMPESENGQNRQRLSYRFRCLLSVR